MVKVEFAKNWAQVFEKAGLKSFDDFFEFSAGQTMNKNKKREVVAMTLDTDGPNKAFFMKRFFKPHFKDMLFTIRNFGNLCSQAVCEWKNINILLQNGIDTYLPVCHGEQMRFGLEKKSFIITKKIEGQALTDFVAANWLHLAQAQKEKIITTLAKLVRRIHEAKISLPDLYLWHIFIPKTLMADDISEDDFAIIDLHRMRCNVTNRNEQTRNLAALNFSMLDKYFDDNIREIFLNAYVGNEQPGNIDDLRRKIKSRSRVLVSRRRKPAY